MTSSALRPLTDEERQFVAANTGLVGHVVYRWYKLDGDEADDAIQDGMFGLIRAAQLYNPSLGFTFSTYAMAWIRQGIQRGRERREGRNWARARRRGDDYVPPVSLDQIHGDNDDMDLHGVVAGPDDPAQDALSSVTCDEISDRALRACLDDLDVAIVVGLAEGLTCAEIARRTGANRQTVMNRRNRLRTRCEAA